MSDIKSKLSKDLGEVVDEINSGIAEGIAQGIAEATIKAESYIKEEIYSAFKSGKGGLARSLKRKYNALRGEVWSDLIYAKVQEDESGTTITAKNAKALTVPISNLAKRMAARGESAKNQNLSLVWPKGKPAGWLVEQKKGRSVLHWKLQRSVFIRGKGYLRRASERLEKELGDIVGTKIVEGVGAK